MRILIVENESDNLNFLATALKAECFEVDSAEDGLTALNMARFNEYDLIVLNSFIPKLPGDQVCQTLRNEQDYTPIVFISHDNSINRKVELLNLGADDYLIKPFSFDEFFARIKAILRRPPTFNIDITKIGEDIIIDSAKHQVTKNGKLINLTNKEFSLLEFIARHDGMVVSRARIIEHVWDMNADIFSNSIEVHIFNLRKKLDNDPDDSIILTVPNRGYKIRTEEQ